MPKSFVIFDCWTLAFGSIGKSEIVSPTSSHAALDAPDRQTAEVRRMVDRRHEHLKRSVLVARRRRDFLHDQVEQWREVAERRVEVERRRAVAGRRIHHRHVELPLIRLELDEQIEDLVVNPKRIGSRSIDLVDDDDRLAAQGQRLAQHEAGLGHRAVERVDDEQHTVDHPQDALDFATEVGVAGRIDDVDLGVLPVDGSVLGEDRDAPLALEGVRVHDAFLDDLVLAERTGLPKHLVHEGRFAMIDVGDDGDVADLHKP